MLRCLISQSRSLRRVLIYGQIIQHKLHYPGLRPPVSRVMPPSSQYCSSAPPPSTPAEAPVSEAQYEVIAEETLESLCSTLEELLEAVDVEPDTDVELSSGVLTLKLGKAGTYVINKQTPNRQIWLSSPVSGPKRYDFSDGGWVYRHETRRLHELLSSELTNLLGTPVDLKSCSYSGR